MDMGFPKVLQLLRSGHGWPMSVKVLKISAFCSCNDPYVWRWLFLEVLCHSRWMKERMAIKFYLDLDGQLVWNRIQSGTLTWIEKRKPHIHLSINCHEVCSCKLTEPVLFKLLQINHILSLGSSIEETRLFSFFFLPVQFMFILTTVKLQNVHPSLEKRLVML